MKYTDEQLREVHDDLLYYLSNINPGNIGAQGMFTGISMATGQPDTCGRAGCTDDHEATRIDFLRRIKLVVEKHRVLRAAQARAKLQ